ncbi:Protein of uncharacterised function (DUF1602) [Mycobacteroides abscessus subsp. abscessus]|nr:Protein of uncharacterised function (DUF1602) [Mycobacteroides abscessus subsp. abscessus]
MTTESQSIFTSSIMWLEKMIVFPCLLSELTSCLNTFEEVISRPVVGSSNKMISGSWIRVLAMATFCLIPLENPPTFLFR